MASCKSNGKDIVVVRAQFLYHIWAQVLRYCAKILASILAAVARTLRMEDIEIAASFCPLRKLPPKLPQVFIVWVYLNSRRCCCSIGRSFHHKFHHKNISHLRSVWWRMWSIDFSSSPIPWMKKGKKRAPASMSILRISEQVAVASSRGKPTNARILKDVYH